MPKARARQRRPCLGRLKGAAGLPPWWWHLHQQGAGRIILFAVWTVTYFDRPGRSACAAGAAPLRLCRRWDRRHGTLTGRPSMMTCSAASLSSSPSMLCNSFFGHSGT